MHSTAAGRSHGAVDPAAKQQEGYAAEHGTPSRMQATFGRGARWRARQGSAPQSRAASHRAAQQHPRVLLLQIPGQGADQVFIPGAVRAPQLRRLCASA